MKLIKINQDHYVVVDDSQIKEGDWLYSFDNGLIVQANRGSADTINSKSLNGRGYGKITHSTQPIDGDGTGACFIDIKQLPIQEVKELIGQVNVEKKANVRYDRKNSEYDEDKNLLCGGFVDGYNECLEDNKEKKYTEEDVIYFVNKSRETGLTAEYLMMTRQPKTEWEVEMIDGQLKQRQ